MPKENGDEKKRQKRKELQVSAARDETTLGRRSTNRAMLRPPSAPHCLCVPLLSHPDLSSMSSGWSHGVIVGPAGVHSGTGSA